jgi:hypothetical protein
MPDTKPVIVADAKEASSLADCSNLIRAILMTAGSWGWLVARFKIAVFIQLQRRVRHSPSHDCLMVAQKAKARKDKRFPAIAWAVRR